MAGKIKFRLSKNRRRTFMKVRRLLCLGMVALLLCSNLPQMEVHAQEINAEDKVMEMGIGEENERASNENVEDYQYIELEDGTLGITKYSGNDKEIVIPVEINGKNVTSIMFAAFRNCSNLTSITIPDSVTNIYGFAFLGCNSLIDLNVDADNPRYFCEDGILYDKNKATLILCLEGKSGSIIIPDSVTNIDSYAFRDCSSLTNITIPKSVTSIGSSAFWGCSSLKSITIPESVTDIGVEVFRKRQIR